MEGAAGVYLVGGACLLLAVVLPQLLRRFAISSPMVLVGVGLLIGLSPLLDVLPVDTSPSSKLVEHITEVTVLVALMGVGLALDRPLSLMSLKRLSHWSAVWRLLAVAMPLTIGGVALLGWWVAGLAPAAALLLGAVLAPTDPVLASDVQVSGPSVGDKVEEMEEGLEDPDDAARSESDEVRFALTAEAGLNDGLAFPFVHLALLLMVGGFALSDAATWVAWYALGKVVVGVVAGLVVGWGLGRVAFRSRVPELRLAEQGEPLLALAALLMAYGAAELVGGYGFLAVFTCALTVRSAERADDYHEAMHGVIERLERLFTLVVLLGLGVATTRGLLEGLDWKGIVIGAALVLLVRPLAGLLALSVLARDASDAGGLRRDERHAVAFFGVRGIGSVYYLAYATNHAELAQEAWLWSTVVVTIVLSVLVHGVLATPWMDRLDRRREEEGEGSDLRPDAR